MFSEMPTIPHLETALTGPLLELEKTFLNQVTEIEAWFRDAWQQTPPLFYGSVDLRNACFKVAPVDTNLFPAGFNNVNPDFLPLCIQAAQSVLQGLCPGAKRLLIIPENHTRNPYYFESLKRLQDILSAAGFEVRIGSLNPEVPAEGQSFTTPSGKIIELKPLQRKEDRIGIENYSPCLVLLNHDLSEGLPDILKNISQKIIPSPNLGWFSRLKSDHFEQYEKVCALFSKVVNIDPWLISTYFDRCDEVDFTETIGSGCLISRAELLLTKIEKKYKEYHIKKTPFLVVKADAGTYGMGVMMIKDPEELKHLNRKQRNKMSKSKGGNVIDKAIIQEGVYTFETWGKDNAVAEPVVYLIGQYVVGGFYRVHKNKTIDENLNAPGMDFYPLAFDKACQAPLESSFECANRFYAYSVISRLAFLAAAREKI